MMAVPELPARNALRITAYRDGPLLVRGNFELRRADGVMLNERRKTIALCRCGKSRLHPFCDGTHKLIGFRAPGRPDGSSGWIELERS
jgi:CDGSH-type Zn-finger protein